MHLKHPLRHALHGTPASSSGTREVTSGVRWYCCRWCRPRAALVRVVAVRRGESDRMEVARVRSAYGQTNPLDGEVKIEQRRKRRKPDKASG